MKIANQKKSKTRTKKTWLEKNAKKLNSNELTPNFLMYFAERIVKYKNDFYLLND